MKLSLEALRDICPHLSPAKAARYLPHVNAAMREFGITTEKRAAAWLAQVAHESMEFTAIVENMNYSAGRLRQVFPKYFRKDPGLADRIAHNPQAIANVVYGGRMGNDTPNSGWAYRARTPVQLTGADNYRAAGRALGVDLLADPDSANRDEIMFRIAGWFWESHGLNALADRDEFRAITKRINGGYNGEASREAYWARAKKALREHPGDAGSPVAAPHAAATLSVTNVAPDAPQPAREPAAAILPAAPAEPVVAATEAAAGPSPAVEVTQLAAPAETAAPASVQGGGPDDEAKPVTAGSASWARQVSAWIAALFASASGYVERAFGLDKQVQLVLICVVAALGVTWMICRLVAERQIRHIASSPQLQNVK